MTAHALPLAATFAAALALPACAQTFTYGERNTDLQPVSDDQFRAPITPTEVELETAVLAGGLEHPWGIATLPDDAGWLVTERPGRMQHLAPDGTLTEVAGMPEVFAQGQGGLLDVALGPNFADDRMVYVTYAKPMGGGLSATAAARGTLSDDLTEVTDLTDIFVQDPPDDTAKHYGSRILFPGDGTAIITTGEHSSMETRVFAQDLDKTYGKVIRVNLDGSIPQDNPFAGQEGAAGSIWSYGHRNIQGAAHDEDGALWTIEHGPAGGDELNRPEPGLNYGWPVISYGENYDGRPIGTGEAAMEGMEQPVYFWDPGHRAGRHGVPRGRGVLRVERRRADRLALPRRRRAARDRGRARDRGGAAAARPRPRARRRGPGGRHPRRADRLRERRRDPRHPEGIARRAGALPPPSGAARRLPALGRALLPAAIRAARRAGDGDRIALHVGARPRNGPRSLAIGRARP